MRPLALVALAALAPLLLAPGARAANCDPVREAPEVISLVIAKQAELEKDKTPEGLRQAARFQRESDALNNQRVTSNKTACKMYDELRRLVKRF